MNEEEEEEIEYKGKNRELDENIKYNFKTFDPVKQLKEVKNFFITITSKRRTGKSTLMKDFLYKIKDFYQTCYVFSLTADLQPDLFNFVHKDNVFKGLDEGVLNEIWANQKAKIEKLRKMKVKDENMPYILLIFDDIIGDPKIKKSGIMNTLAIAARHCMIACIVITQTFKGIPPTLRTNVDLAIAFFLNSYDDRDEFARGYLSTRNNKTGMKIFEEITKDPYKAIVIANFINSKNPEDYIFTYVAKLKVPDFKIVKKATYDLPPSVTNMLNEKNKINTIFKVKKHVRSSFNTSNNDVGN